MDIVSFLKEEKFLMEKQFSEIRQEFKRDAYSELEKSNIIILYGLRGTGKTTIMAQKYLEVTESLAIHGEHMNLAGYSIKDLISSLKHVLNEGYLFIDEITKLKHWAEELKVLSDFYPRVKIIVTGSSAVDLQEARQTLARRAVFIKLGPLTLNEFLKIKYQRQLVKFNPFSSDILTAAIKTEFDAREKQLDAAAIINEYKKMNLPYLIEKPVSTLLDVLDRVIYEDIGGAGSFDESILQKFWPLLKLLALSEKTSYDNLSKDLGVGKGTVIKMIEYLVKANVIRTAYPYAYGKTKVRKEPKYLFVSPTIRSVILGLLGEKEREIGLVREDLFAMHLDELFYLKDGPDYVWKGTIFEIGGPSKDSKQFKNVKFKGRKYIVHDGLEISNGEVFKLPFYIFLSQF